MFVDDVGYVADVQRLVAGFLVDGTLPDQFDGVEWPVHGVQHWFGYLHFHCFCGIRMCVD